MSMHPAFAGARKVARVWAGFSIHLTAYLAVNALLVIINLATTPDQMWVYWPLLGWGVGLLAHAAVAFTVARGRVG